MEVVLVPGDIKRLAEKTFNLSEKIKECLKNQTAINVEALVDAYVPAAAGFRNELIELVTVAEKSCQAIAAYDWSGVTARLQRLVTDSTMVLHGKQHGLSKYLVWCEVVIRHFLDSKGAA